MKTSLIYLLAIGYSGSINAQLTGHPQWIEPVQASLSLVGQPSDRYIPIRDKTGVYLLTEDGVRKAMPYDSLSHIHDQFWKIWKNGLQGMMHLTQGELVPPVFHQVEPVEKSSTVWAFTVKKYGMHAIVSDRNVLLLPYQKYPYRKCSLVGDTILAFHSKNSTSKWNEVYVSKSGKPVNDSIARVQQLPELKIIAPHTYLLTTAIANGIKTDTFHVAEQFVNGIAMVKEDSLWGYIHPDGTWVLTPRFQEASSFDSHGHAVVKSNGKYGVVRKDGIYQIPPQFTLLEPSLLGYFKFKEEGQLGLLDTSGMVILEPGTYRNFQPAGTEGLAAQSGDSLLIFTREGAPLPMNKVLDCSITTYDANFLLKLRIGPWSKRNTSFAYGVYSSDGSWRIPPVMKGKVYERRYFFLVEAVVEPCCEIGILRFDQNTRGKFGVFNREGIPVIHELVDIKHGKDERFVIFGRNQKFGILSPTQVELHPEFDNIKEAGHGWIIVTDGSASGILKWID